jgi:hypothetical protein
MGSPSVAMGDLSQPVVAGFRWNQWPRSPGLGGKLAMESAEAFVWNGWQFRRGINGRFHLEAVAAVPWNMQCPSPTALRVISSSSWRSGAALA